MLPKIGGQSVKLSGHITDLVKPTVMTPAVMDISAHSQQ
jgi:hypothetical protein